MRPFAAAAFPATGAPAEKTPGALSAPAGILAMARTPKKPPNPVAKADIARRRKAGPMPPKKGKGTPYDREREKAVDPDQEDQDQAE